MPVKSTKSEIEPAASEELANSVDTYLPPIDELCRKAGIDRKSLAGRTVAIPTNLFKFLLSHFLEKVPVDEETYLKENLDVAGAVQSGALRSGRHHFITNGYFEGRRPGDQPVDEQWYLGTYPDVAQAYRKRQITDLKRHYNDTGRFEGRAGSAKQSQMRQAWENALK